MENNHTEQTEFITAYPSLNSKNGGIAFSLNVAAFLITSMVAGFILVLGKIENGSDAYVYINYLASPVALTVCCTVFLKVAKIPYKAVFPVKCSPKYYFIGVLLIFGLLFAVSPVNTYVVKLFELCGYVPRESGSYYPDLSGANVIAGLLVMAVLPALVEEFLFRGVILNCCESSMGSIATMFTVGFCFSLFHCSPEQTVYQFIVGCVFAFIAVKSGSILPSVLMHLINNGLIVIFAACKMFDESGNRIMSQTANIIVMVFAFLALVGGLVWLFLDKKKLKKGEKRGVAKFYIFAAAGIAVLGLLWILSLVGCN